MEPEARNQVNYYQAGMVGHWLNINDGELYFGKIIRSFQDFTNSQLKVYLTLATDFGSMTIRVY
jgi:hypothetical protein